MCPICWSLATLSFIAAIPAYMVYGSRRVWRAYGDNADLACGIVLTVAAGLCALGVITSLLWP